MFSFPILSFIIWIPLFGMSILMCLSKTSQKSIRYATLITTIIQSSGIIWIAYCFDTTIHTLQWVEKIPWIDFNLGSFGFLSIVYFLGVDGCNLPLLMLAAIIVPIGVIASWNIKKYIKLYFIIYLFLSMLIFGVFLSSDLFLFYFFMEISLIPIFFLISIWGNQQGGRAAIKFLLYNLAGALCILIVMIALSLSIYDPIHTGIQANIPNFIELSSFEQIKNIQQLVAKNSIAAQHFVHTLDITLLQSKYNFIPNSLFHIDNKILIFGYSIKNLFLFLLLIGLFIKIGAAPMHIWLPDAHMAAPTAISIILAGIMLKIGGYGIVRIIYSVFAKELIAGANIILGICGTISVLYGALCAIGMQNWKKMIAYSSIVHMGFVLVGLASCTIEGIQGAFYTMVSHGLTVTILFMLVAVLSQRTGDKTIAYYSGLASKMPHYTIVVALGFVMALGLPGCASFIAKFLVMLGTVQAASIKNILPTWIVFTTSIGMFMGTIYFLRTFYTMFLGKFSIHHYLKSSQLQDLKKHECILFFLLFIIVILLGIFPHVLLNIMHETMIYYQPK